MKDNWYEIANVQTVDSPSLVLYSERLDFNIQQMLALVEGDRKRLMPHIKTNKMPKVLDRMIAAGIDRFKASTIAEAEIAARAGAKAVLVAHQLVGPKVERFLQLAAHFPKTKISTITDNIDSAGLLNQKALALGLQVPVYVDINNGMDRSGIKITKALENLMGYLKNCGSLQFQGLHVYDGHLRDPDFDRRNAQIENDFAGVQEYFESIRASFPKAKLISGGTPSFTSHRLKADRITSPGTCVLWDWGYGEKLSEQPFKHAALLVTRIISKPTEGVITLDLGHKAVAPENPLDKRVKFLNISDYELLSQSEEHGVMRVKDWDQWKVGDVLYGIPYHICPTVNLHDEVSLIVKGKKSDTWEIPARRRRLQF